MSAPLILRRGKKRYGVERWREARRTQEEWRNNEEKNTRIRKEEKQKTTRFQIRSYLLLKCVFT
jgi:hypothetical protein